MATYTDEGASLKGAVIVGEARIHKMPPGPERWKERSRFYLGIAEAMAKQWGTWRSVMDYD